MARYVTSLEMSKIYDGSINFFIVRNGSSFHYGQVIMLKGLVWLYGKITLVSVEVQVIDKHYYEIDLQGKGDYWAIIFTVLQRKNGVI